MDLSGRTPPLSLSTPRLIHQLTSAPSAICKFQSSPEMTMLAPFALRNTSVWKLYHGSPLTVTALTVPWHLTPGIHFRGSSGKHTHFPHFCPGGANLIPFSLSFFLSSFIHPLPHLYRWPAYRLAVPAYCSTSDHYGEGQTRGFLRGSRLSRSRLL